MISSMLLNVSMYLSVTILAMAFIADVVYDNKRERQLQSFERS